MRIALDYTAAITQHAGIGRYTRQLVAALQRIDTADRFTLFSAQRPDAERPFPVADNFRSRASRLGNRRMTILWHRLRVPLPIELYTGPADVVHGPDFTLPPTLGAARVVTVHDLAFLTHPECALPSLVTYLRAVVPRAVRSADRIIAVSQQTASDLGEHLGVPEEKIRVIPLGVDPMFAVAPAEAVLDAECARLGLVRPFVLAVGTIEPRKNFETLIAAFARATRQPDGPRMLVIAGRPGWLYEGVYAAVREHNVSNQVMFLDSVSDHELVTLYHAASALAMPSLYEGFGIPVLEAMASGTPVVCGNAGSLPEVAGDAALLIAPRDETALSAALVAAVADESLQQRLIARGRERASRFTWNQTAEAHLAVYREVGK